MNYTTFAFNHLSDNFTQRDLQMRGSSLTKVWTTCVTSLSPAQFFFFFLIDRISLKYRGAEPVVILQAYTSALNFIWLAIGNQCKLTKRGLMRWKTLTASFWVSCS